ncbi:MAG: fibrobacter succinogenes major paralogous domain-containing protein, partial [Bacteroidales bacterium]|nr:fibrobacter succinogenes major paralogous domain-containing protein [Bacteroidales bacterium]
PSGNQNISLIFHIPYCDDKTILIQLQDCEPITYNGVTYDHSDIYTIGQYLTYKGCDSTIILDVRIREHLFSEMVVNTCEETYDFGGQTYTESGIYQQSFVTEHGCDSIVSLRLTLDNGFRDERDGNVYCTITFGDQVWMRDNLKYLPQVTSPDNTSGGSARYYVYGYNGSNVNEAKATENYEKYGVLYNWEAAMTACPAGWHLPSDTEWSLLEIYLENNGYNFDGYRDSDNDRDTHNVIAKAMAATSEWTRSDVSNAVGWLQEKNNDSGFNGKPGGEKYIHGFQSINECAIWWTSTPNTGDNCWDRYLYFSRDFCNRTNNHRSIGMGVRCIQD